MNLLVLPLFFPYWFFFCFAILLFQTEAISSYMSLALYSNALLSVYWCQILVILDVDNISALALRCSFL